MVCVCLLLCMRFDIYVNDNDHHVDRKQQQQQSTWLQAKEKQIILFYKQLGYC